MRSLLIRFFLSFWLIIGVTIGIAALGGYWYAERVRHAYEHFDIRDDLLEASAALRSAGRDGLAVWLRNYPEIEGLRLLVLDGRGRELLGRPIPRHVIQTLRRQAMPDPDGEHRDPENLLRARPLTQLVGPDGVRYTFILVPNRGLLRDRDGPARGVILFFAILISATVSYFLARTISRPVRKLRSATRSLADGELDSRVEPSVARRKDELGALARDFDGMAASLQKAAGQQIELSRNVSHELRSPLARLKVALEIARQKTGDIAELDRIDEESERLNALIGQILSYTRLDSLQAADKETSSLSDLVAEVAADVNFECESQDVNAQAVRTEIASGIRFHMHMESMRSAVENILRNAVRHTREGSEVLVRLHRAAGTISIDIVDKGPGVADSDLELLFEPFFRTPGTRTDGSGLGLAIARRAIESHGGSILASNVHGGGLSVSIALPTT